MNSILIIFLLIIFLLIIFLLIIILIIKTCKSIPKKQRKEVKQIFFTMVFIIIIISVFYYLLVPSNIEQATKILSKHNDTFISMRNAELNESYIWFDAQEYIVTGEKGKYHLARNTLNPIYPFNRLFEASKGITPHYGGGQGFP